MIIGYELTGHDNDSYMLGEETRRAISDEEREFFDWRFTKDGGQHPATCPKCGRKLDPNYLNPAFKLRKKRLDVSSTYDGYTIVSTRFREFCEDAGVSNVEFISLPSHPTHFWFRVSHILKVDTEASHGIRFLYPCDQCEAYAGVFGASKLVFVGVGSTVPKGISRTDIEFAQAHEQAPIIILDPDLTVAMKAERFRGICLDEIEI